METEMVAYITNICRSSWIRQLHEPIFDPVVTASGKMLSVDHRMAK